MDLKRIIAERLKANSKVIFEGDYEAYMNKAGAPYWGDVGGGVLAIAKDSGRILVGLRSPYVNSPNTWGTIGGKLDDEENVNQAVEREFEEETGYSGPIKLIPAFVFKDADVFTYYNFIALVPKEFIPKLDWETARFEWVNLPTLFKLSPRHQGLDKLLKDPKSVEIIKHYSNPAK